jgi:hypothetical protein
MQATAMRVRATAPGVVMISWFGIMGPGGVA